MKKPMHRLLTSLLIAACALALAACGGSSSNSAPDVQAKQLHRSGKAQVADYEAAVQELYIAYFGRPADPNGLLNFSAQLQQANAPTDVLGLAQAYATNPRVTALINSFETSAESNALYGGSNTTAFVSAIFQNVLGRQPAQAGLDFWVNAIDSGNLTQGNAALSIMAGALKNNTAQGVLDAQLINNRLAVADYFTAQLTTQGVVSSYSGHTAAGVARTMLNGVTAGTDVTSYNSSFVTSSIATLLAPVNVTLDKSSLTFTTFVGFPLSPQSINLSLTGSTTSGTASYYGKVISDQPATLQATFMETSANTAVVTVQPSASAPMTTSGTLTVELCADYACTEVVWSQAVPYSVSLFSIPTTSVAMTGYQGAASQSASVSVTPADTLGRLSFSPTTNDGASWLSATHASDGSISVTASAAGLAAGNYYGSVVVTAAGASPSNSPTLYVPIAFTVGDGISAPASGTLTLTATSTLASLNGSIPVTFKSSGSPAWTATSDQSWLVLGTASGTGPGTITYSVASTYPGTMANWSSATANITIKAQGLTSAVVPVTLNKNLPEIYTTSPNVVAAGRASTVQVTGRGLSQLTGANQITVNGASGITGSITSDTSAALTLPAQAAGTSILSVPNTAAIATRTGSVGVVNLSVQPYSFTAGSGETPTALYDPVRTSLYVLNKTTSTLVRYHYNGSQMATDGTPVAGIMGIAFAPDRSTIYALSSSGNFYAIDPDSLQTKATYTAPATSSSRQYIDSTGLAVTSNMRIWINGGGITSVTYFDINSGTIKTLPVSASLISDPNFYSSGDGSHMFMSQNNISPIQPNGLYLTSTDTLTLSNSAPNVIVGVNYTQDGSAMLVDGVALYNGNNFSLIANVPQPPTGQYSMNGVISYDGQRVYQMVTLDENSLVIDHIDVFDTTQIQSSNSTLIKIGQIPITDQATSCYMYNFNCVVGGTMAISPLGDTIFWVGNQGLVVVPIPSELSGIKSQKRKLLKAKAN